MKAIILGTGTSQGIPVIGCNCQVCKSKDKKDKRLRTSIWVSSEETSLIIDTSPDFRYQMLKWGITQIDAILFTHEHNDHTAGLDDIRPYNFMQKKDMPFYGLPRVLNGLKSRFSYVFTGGAYPGAPRATCHYLHPFETVNIGDIKIEAIPVMHGNLPILGYRFGRFAFITDASQLSEKAIQHLQGLDTLVINALQKIPHHSHYNLDECLEIIKIINPQKTFISHVSHTMGLVADWEKLLPKNVFPAFDGLQIEW